MIPINLKLFDCNQSGPETLGDQVYYMQKNDIDGVDNVLVFDNVTSLYKEPTDPYCKLSEWEMI